jgi:hypothetical protein
MTGTAGDLHTGVRSITLTYDDGAGTSGTICTQVHPPAAISPTWSCPWNSLLVPDGTYVLTLVVTDFAGNTFTAPTKDLIVDNTPPVIDDVVIVPDANPQFQHVDPTDPAHLYYNPNPGFSGSFFVDVTAHDDGTGMNRVEFPDIDGVAGGFTPDAPTAGGNLATTAIVQPLGPTYRGAYWWVPGAMSPGLLNAVAFDNAWAMLGDPTTNAPFRITPDADAPTGGSIQLTSPFGGGWVTGPDVEVALTPGSDALSGLDTWHVERSESSITAGTCDLAWGPWSMVGGVRPVGAVTDSGTSDNRCYRYRLVQVDNVGNVDGSLVAAGEVLVDRTAPFGTILNPVGTAPAINFVNGIVQIDGTAGDLASGVASIEVRALGTPTPLICAGPIFVSPAPPPTRARGARAPTATGTRSTTPAMAPYTIELTIIDVAGNVGTATVDVFVDRTPPAFAFKQFVKGTNPMYQHVDPNPSILWVSNAPARNGTFSVEYTATDGTGSGVRHVVYPPSLGAAGRRLRHPASTRPACRRTAPTRCSTSGPRVPTSRACSRSRPRTTCSPSRTRPHRSTSRCAPTTRRPPVDRCPTPTAGTRRRASTSRSRRGPTPRTACCRVPASATPACSATSRRSPVASAAPGAGGRPRTAARRSERRPTTTRRSSTASATATASRWPTTSTTSAS